MPDDERIEQLELEVKVLLSNNKGLKDKIEELKEKNKNLEDELNKYIVKMSDEQYRRLVDIIRDETSKEWKDKIKAKIEEVKDGTYDAKIVLQSLLEED